MQLYWARLSRSYCFVAGVLLFLAGCVPWVFIFLTTDFSLAGDRHPYFVYFLILFLCGWYLGPVLILFGLAAARDDGGAAKRRLNALAFGPPRCPR